MIKAIIFDLDGVIVHTDQFHYLAWKRLCDSLGIPFDESTNQLLRGVSRKESLEIILKLANRDYSESMKSKFLRQKNEYYIEYIRTLTKNDVDDELRSILVELKKRGIRLAIGSSSKNTMMILDSIELTSYFDVIVDGTMIHQSKPDPEVFLLAAQLLGVNQEECMVIEDAVSGIEAAHRASMKVINFNHQENEMLADGSIYDFYSLLSFLD